MGEDRRLTDILVGIEIHTPSNMQLLLNCCAIIYSELTALKWVFVIIIITTMIIIMMMIAREYLPENNRATTLTAPTHIHFQRQLAPGLAKLQSLNEVTLWRMDQ